MNYRSGYEPQSITEGENNAGLQTEGGQTLQCKSCSHNIPPDVLLPVPFTYVLYFYMDPAPLPLCTNGQTALHMGLSHNLKQVPGWLPSLSARSRWDYYALFHLLVFQSVTADDMIITCCCRRLHPMYFTLSCSPLEHVPPRFRPHE